MKLFKLTIAYIQANIKFVKTDKHRKIKYDHIKSKQAQIIQIKSLIKQETIQARDSTT